MLRRLAKNGDYVIGITSSCDPALVASLANSGIKVISIGELETPPRRQMLKKVLAGLRFRRATWSIISGLGPRTALYVAGLECAIVVGRRVKEYDYLLQVHELYDNNRVCRLLMGWFLRNAACVVVPEESRAAILRVWYKLKETPVVLPNRPNVANRFRRRYVNDLEARRALESIPPEKKIVLYQGWLRGDRYISDVASCIHRMGGDWQFVAMGMDEGLLPELLKVCPSMVRIPYISAPQHLEITSHAYIGIASYDYSCLNNIFCAPNKIWEYSAFGIPMLCNDVPGLRFTVEKSGSGVCCDFRDPDAVEASLRKIDAEYSHFEARALKFYEHTDGESAFRKAYSRWRRKEHPAEAPQATGSRCGTDEILPVCDARSLLRRAK